MPRLTIDGQEVEVPEGTTILQAARSLGIDIPALCWREGFEPGTSCMVCVVRVDGAAALVPSCATAVRAGMCVESESEEVRAARRTAIELILSDHTGDCVAPCHQVAPGGLELPVLIHGMAAGDLAGAAAALRAAGVSRGQELDLQRPERACRRRRADQSVAIGRLVEFVARAAPEEEADGEPPGVPPESEPVGFSVHLGGLREGELETFLEGASDAPQVQPADEAAGYSAAEAQAEAARCLHCDCSKAQGCNLREIAQAYGARAARFRGARRTFVQIRAHPEVIFEPGKCILCGLCLQVAERRGEPLGLCFTGRGFETSIGVPFEEAISRALQVAARECAQVCPTAAIALRES